MAELADARDLKSRELLARTGSTPVFGTKFVLEMTGKNKRRGVEQLVARRAHNPEAIGSNPIPATMH